MNLVKCKFLDADRRPKGREYTYAASEEFDAGEIVADPNGKELVITEAGVSQEAIAGFEHRVKYVSRLIDSAEPVRLPVDDFFQADEIGERPELIVVEQLPVITERLALLGEEIDRRISEALSLECTEDTVKTVKGLRAELNKDFTFWEGKRKQVKTAVMSPYEEFESIYRRYVSDKYRNADAQLKTMVDGVEGEIKRRKNDELKAYFDEYRLSRNVDFVNMDSWRPNITLSVSLKSLKEEGKTYIDRICEDLALIETQEDKTEILVEYRRSLNVSQAITTVSARRKAMDELKKQQEELEASRQAELEAVKRVEEAVPERLTAPAIVPAAEPDPVRTLKFSVTAPVSKLRELKKFLDNGGFHYE